VPDGYVGIGTANPKNKLQLGEGGSSMFVGQDFVIGNGTEAMSLNQYVGLFGWVSSNNIGLYPNNGTGYVGINAGSGPNNKLQIGYTPGFTDYDFAIGRNAQAMAIYQGPNFTNLQSTANITINPKNGAGYVGINVGANPTNKLQIGSVGSTGFAGNDLAIGNGTNAIAIYQTDASTLIGSTTDIVLKPRNNGTGRVGINTNTPRAPLDVASAININSVNSNYGYGYLTFDNANNVTGFSTDDNPVQNVSIIASGRIYAREFDAFSDARIKNITGASDASQDLETINTLHITNYTMKDKVMYGSKHYKKVIAQEVEKVYPQVISKHTDFIPNVYQVISKLTKTADGYLLSFNAPHKISKAAKKLQVLMDGESSMQQFDVVSIPSGNEVIINATEIKGNKIFVYGEEVDDFRTVDYEGLTTLNISATQEISRLVKKQAAIIDRLEKRLSALEAKPLQRLVGIK
jgi:hypothetical protein